MNSPATDFAFRGGIIAAGQGERLRSYAPQKPLAQVAGKTLIERTLRAFAAAGASDAVVIINQTATEVRDHVVAAALPLKIQWLVETTASSMHSFLRVMKMLGNTSDPGPFLLSTVDTIASVQTYRRVICHARSHPHADLVLALSDLPQDDEKPLLAEYNERDHRITALGDKVRSRRYATAGIYGVRSTILKEASEAEADGLGALRHFFGRLLQRRYNLQGVPVEQTVDIDKPADIKTAEEFLRNANQ